MRSRDDARRVVKRLVDLTEGERPNGLSLGGAVGSAGTPIDTPPVTLPTAVEGYVLAWVDVGGVIVLQSVDPDTLVTGTGGGRYRALLYELDGAGGFDFLIDEDGHPIYELTDLE